ncbi:hypothetical protein [Rhodoferax sp.]|uniref:hypothetical protein n=1 Tax=Rhodoferax sp. TaxID=50421 RepID=UPI0026147D7D|nr:hypothetical protein [Rhodoferax sp.]MDD2925277.1 hypothetical protein [Rhodoferax sp.]
MRGSECLGLALAQRLGLTPDVLGTPAPPLATQWDVELQAATVLAHNQVIGLEISEFQACWPGSDVETSPEPLIDALSPLLAKICPGIPSPSNYP